MRKSSLVVALAFGISLQLSGTQISIGQIGIITNLGTAQFNNIVFLINQTGDCSTGTPALPTVCDLINISSWSLEIDYTPMGGSPTSQVDSGGTIAPNDFPSAINAPLDASLPYWDNTGDPCCLNVINQLIFTGTLSSSSFNISDGTSQSVFIAQNPFTFTLTFPISQDLINLGATDNYSSATDNTAFAAAPLLVPNATSSGPPTGGIPEPASALLLISGVAIFGVRRFLVR